MNVDISYEKVKAAVFSAENNKAAGVEVSNVWIQLSLCATNSILEVN